MEDILQCTDMSIDTGTPEDTDYAVSPIMCIVFIVAISTALMYVHQEYYQALSDAQAASHEESMI